MTLLTTLQNDGLNAAIFTLALVIALAALFVCRFVLWAARGRQDPADVEVTAPVRSNVTPPDGVVQDANGRFRVIREVKR